MGTQNSMLHVRMDSELKRKATEALGELACMSHHPTVEARDTTARTSLRLFAVLNVLSSTPARAKRLAPFSSARLAPSPDGPLTHFASPRGEKCRPGLSASDAVRLLFHRIVADQAFPLELKVPNARTRRAMAEVDEMVKTRKAREAAHRG